MRDDIRHPPAHFSGARYASGLAEDAGSRYAALALRHRIFAGEMGAMLRSPYPGLDWDELDPICDHLVVRECETDAIVATTRLLSCHRARQHGQFYSQCEFDLSAVLAHPGRFLEVGRTCVDSGRRASGALVSLWTALADYARRGNYDYLMGCASIPAGPGGFAVDAVMRQVSDHLAPETFRVSSHLPVPEFLRCTRDESGIPPLLRTYLRFGAWVCGEPSWDPQFNVMDLFVLLPVERLGGSYGRRLRSESSLPVFNAQSEMAHALA